MAYLNLNIPPIYCNIRREYLYDFKQNHGSFEECVVFGLASMPGRATLFHVLLPNGAVYWRLPISAFFQKCFSRSEVPDMPLHTLQLWNNFSYYPSITAFDFLISQKGKYLGKDKKFYSGEYLFTIDWAHPESNIIDTEHSEIPSEHKCGHVLALDNGNYAIQPNNRILWNIPSFTTSKSWPDYKVQNTEWNVEKEDWITDESNKMFYDITEKDKS